MAANVTRCLSYSLCKKTVTCITTSRYARLAIFAVLVIMLWRLKSFIFKDHYLNWSQISLPGQELQADYFVLGRDMDIYMYSAFVNSYRHNEKLQNTINSVSEIEIVITALDSSRVNYICCVLFNDKTTLFTTSAYTYYMNTVRAPSVTQRIIEYFYSSNYVAHQLSCTVTISSSLLVPSHVTLTSSSCSSDITDYLPILRSPRVPGGLALCAKISHSGGLDPEKVIEWFEVQRILGVDKILIFDLNSSENVSRVFRYYQKLGILDLQPYELPGLPRNRSLMEEWKKTAQFNHDETMAVLECRQRMAGYDYIMSHDVDEFIIPRADITLKKLVQKQLSKEPNAAVLYFYTQFFITTWESTNPEEDLMVKRYRKSTVPRWECYKYIYLPSRVKATITHKAYTVSDKFTELPVSPHDAILHHYRQCPEDTWGTCTVTTHNDNIMTRYHDLETRVMTVRNATFIT